MFDWMSSALSARYLVGLYTDPDRLSLGDIGDRVKPSLVGFGNGGSGSKVEEWIAVGLLDRGGELYGIAYSGAPRGFTVSAGACPYTEQARH
jgi:hypothetical protein